MAEVWRKDMTELLRSDHADWPAQEENIRALLVISAARRYLRLGPTYRLWFTKTVRPHPTFPKAKEVTLTLEIREMEDA